MPLTSECPPSLAPARHPLAAPGIHTRLSRFPLWRPPRRHPRLTPRDPANPASQAPAHPN
eukprot:9553587-Alexandrium_andersonii.AAC.2